MNAVDPAISLSDPFSGEGEMARLCRSLDWARTPLGPVISWPAELRMAVRAALESAVPLSLWCGPEAVLIYNDAYRPVLGTKHPSALGRPGTEVWSDRESEAVRAAARESEGRYHFLTNAIPVQVWTATADGALDYVSDRVAEYFGRTPSEVIGDQWLTVLHPDDLDHTIARWRASLESGEPYEVEFRLWSAAHRAYRWHLGRAIPQRDPDGRIIRWFGSNTEIEERKQAEVELRRLTAEATEADRAKAAFLAAMSHELRTPLNAIGGYAQLMEMGVRGPVTEEQRIDLLKIQRSKNHLDALVSDVLNFAKLGSGKVEYHLTDVDVHGAIQSVLEMVTPQIAAKRLRIAPYSTPRLLGVVADADKLRQILINLFGNALKFTPAGGTISIDVKPTPSEVAISVADTGIGISEEDRERIFEPFTQAGKALDVRDTGVGLGLAISRQLARAMRGDLRVTSALGAGSTFTLTLPRKA